MPGHELAPVKTRCPGPKEKLASTTRVRPSRLLFPRIWRPQLSLSSKAWHYPHLSLRRLRETEVLRCFRGNGAGSCSLKGPPPSRNDRPSRTLARIENAVPPPAPHRLPTVSPPDPPAS